MRALISSEIRRGDNIQDTNTTGNSSDAGDAMDIDHYGAVHVATPQGECECVWLGAGGVGLVMSNVLAFDMI